MELIAEWNKIRKHFNKSFSSNFYVSVASVDSENNPTVTPIGSMFLNDNQTGFYFEKFPSKLPKHAEENPNVCLLGVNSGRFFLDKIVV
ncbi:pyridoxamine 5'-phosphate oxidase family protein [Zobellia nedashkovskayae]